MRASAQILVERPVEAVWEWAADPRHWHRWQDDVGEVQLDGRLAQGTRFTARFEYGGESHQVEYEIVERRAPRRQVVRAVGGPVPFRGALELAEGVGGTRVVHMVEAGPDDALARFLFVAARPLVRHGMRRRILSQLERLKTMVELEAAL